MKLFTSLFAICLLSFGFAQEAEESTPCPIKEITLPEGWQYNAEESYVDDDEVCATYVHEEKNMSYEVSIISLQEALGPFSALVHDVDSIVTAVKKMIEWQIEEGNVGAGEAEEILAMFNDIAYVHIQGKKMIVTQNIYDKESENFEKLYFCVDNGNILTFIFESKNEEELPLEEQTDLIKLFLQ